MWEEGKIYALRARSGPDTGKLVFMEYRGGEASKRSSWRRIGLAPSNWDGSTGPTPVPADSAIPYLQGEGNIDRIGFPDAARMVAQGASFGWADELVGLLGGDAETSRARVNQIRADHPKSALAAEMVGGAVLPGVGGAAMGTRMIPALGRVGAGALGGAIGGGVAGAIQGAGDSPPGERFAGALGGGGFGAVAGGALGGATALTGRGASRLAGADMHADDIARSNLVRSLREANLTPAQVEQRLGLMPQGPVERGGAVIADLDPALQRTARAAVNQSAELSRTGGPVQAITRREAGANARVAGQLDNVAGVRARDFPDARRRAADLKEDTRVRVYAPLDEAGPIHSTPVREAIAGNRLLHQAAAEVELTPGNPATFRQLQGVRDYAEGMVSEHSRSGNTYWFEKWKEAYREIDEALKNIPGVAAADEAYMRASRTLDAFDEGREWATKSPLDIVDHMNTLPEEARDAFRHGVLQNVSERMQRREMGGAGLRNSFIDAGRTNEDFLRILAQSDEQFEKLIQGLEHEEAMRGTFRAISGNSTTAQQQGDAAALTIPGVPRGGRDWILAAASAIAASKEQQRRAANILGQILLSQGPAAAERVANQMIARSISGGIGAAGGAAVSRSIQNPQGQGGAPK